MGMASGLIGLTSNIIPEARRKVSCGDRQAGQRSPPNASRMTPFAEAKPITMHVMKSGRMANVTHLAAVLWEAAPASFSDVV